MSIIVNTYQVCDSTHTLKGADSGFGSIFVALQQPNMQGTFVGFLRARLSLAPKTGVMIVKRANHIRGKPPKDPIGPKVSSQENQLHNNLTLEVLCSN